MRARLLVSGMLGALTFLAACADPLADVPKLSDVELAEDAHRAGLANPNVNSDEPVARPGLLGTMLGGGSQSGPSDNRGGTGGSEAVTSNETDKVGGAGSQSGGLFGLFRKRPEDAPQVSEDTSDPAGTEPEQTQLAAMQAPEAETSDAPRGGLFGRANRRGSAAKPPSVPPGTLLSFGLVKPVCDLPRAKRGKETGVFPERGKTWRLYDSAPGSTAPHPFYVTGFDDGCARTFTAAVAVFGAPQMHELLRYGLPAKVQPYSETDQAYEKIKSRICKVGRGKPCGARLAKLEKNTVFVSAYEKYGNNSRWFNMLLHDGAVAATDVKSGG